MKLKTLFYLLNILGIQHSLTAILGSSPWEMQKVNKEINFQVRTLSEQCLFWAKARTHTHIDILTSCDC